MNEPRVDLARTTLGVLVIGGLAVGSFWILSPFLPAFVWAVMVVVATWPLLGKAQAALGGRRGPAVALLTVVMLLVFVLPLVLAVVVIADSIAPAQAWLGNLVSQPFPAAPDWLARVPLVGDRAVAAWARFAGESFPEIAAQLEPYAAEVARWMLAEAGAVGMVFLQCLLIVILAAVLYTGGEAWGAWMRAFGRRLGGDRGEGAVVLAGQAIRGVALGVVVTAIVQSALGGLGAAVAGVPFAGLLTGIMFVLCIAQVGPLLVLLGATAWLFANGATGWGIFMLVWSVAVGLLDNVLRPVLIRRGADLPLLLIFAGVIGGLLSFGLIGLFVGPVILAVTYTLVDAWVADRPTPPA